jgi:uncharacterized protein YcbK (DUF882 family)
MRNFEQNEFTCDGVVCFDKMDKQFLSMLDNARDYAGIAFSLTSTWRSIEYSKKKGWSLTSSHTLGLAVDISASSSREKWIIVNALIKAGFTRIGIGSNFIHVDYDQNKPQNLIWTY